MIQVIKIGGGVLENEVQRDAFLRQFAAIEGSKVLVHGGGRLATTMADRLGVETQMIDGRRVVVYHAAAHAVDTQHHPADIAIVGNSNFAGNLQFAAM